MIEDYTMENNQVSDINENNTFNFEVVLGEDDENMHNFINKNGV